MRSQQFPAREKLALKLDPLSSYAHTIVGFTCSGAGRHAEAVQACERAVELDHESFLACLCLHHSLRGSGRFEESVAVGEQALAMSGRHPWTMATLAVTFADWDKTTDADALYAEMVARARRHYMSPVLLACAAAAASRENEAIRHAREAFEVCDPVQIFFQTLALQREVIRVSPFP